MFTLFHAVEVLGLFTRRMACTQDTIPPYVGLVSTKRSSDLAEQNAGLNHTSGEWEMAQNVCSQMRSACYVLACQAERVCAMIVECEFECLFMCDWIKASNCRLKYVSHFIYFS